MVPAPAICKQKCDHIFMNVLILYGDTYMPISHRVCSVGDAGVLRVGIRISHI